MDDEKRRALDEAMDAAPFDGTGGRSYLPRPKRKISSGVVCSGGIDPGFGECPICGATMDDSCKFDPPS